MLADLPIELICYIVGMLTPHINNIHNHTQRNTYYTELYRSNIDIINLSCTCRYIRNIIIKMCLKSVYFPKDVSLEFIYMAKPQYIYAPYDSMIDTTILNEICKFGIVDIDLSNNKNITLPLLPNNIRFASFYDNNIWCNLVYVHNGHIMADHEYDNIYIICGNSGKIPYTPLNIYLSYYDLSISPDSKPIHNDTCCYKYGKQCSEKKLHRKWSCCNKQIYGNMRFLTKIPGCIPIN